VCTEQEEDAVSVYRQDNLNLNDKSTVRVHRCEQQKNKEGSVRAYRIAEERRVGESVPDRQKEQEDNERRIRESAPDHQRRGPLSVSRALKR